MTILDEAREGMDYSIRPQDDLFGHVNGRWFETVEIPSDRSSWGPFTQLAELSEKRVHALIEGLAAERGDDTAPDEVAAAEARKIGDLYASFMDEDAVEARGAEPLREGLRSIALIEDLAGLASYLGSHERNGGSGLFGSYIDTDDGNSERYLVNLVQGGLGLPDESYYRDDKFAEIRGKYLAHVERMFGLAGVDDVAARARAVVEVETRLAQGHWERAETRDVLRTYNLTPFERLAQQCPAFDWTAWISALGGSEETLAETVVRQPSYLEHLSATLEDVPLDHWRSWLSARAVFAAAPYLSSEFVEANFDFYGRALNGTPDLRARWKRGVALVERSIGEAVGKRYVAEHFPPSSKAMMDDLVANLLEAYRRSISELDWMSEETKSRAHEKLTTFLPKIGYPDEFRDYSALEVVADDLLANVAAANAFETDRQLAKIGSPVDRGEWLMLPQTVNAYYNPNTNEICFPAGILQSPFFSPDADPAENYGGIGAVIGHEIGHGFDDQGAQYDGEGNLNDWWTAEDKQNFADRSKKLAEQYDGFEPRDLPGEHVNGSLTVGENIGDLGGLTIAHLAYLISLDGGAVPEVDGVTGSQRLFLNWGYIWRTKRRKEQALQFLTTDPHSPAEFRANIVRNLDEFHTAFGTEPGDGLWLDPTDRVRIW